MRVRNPWTLPFLLNFFTLDEERRLVNLPGYGYAEVSEKIKVEWQEQVSLYLALNLCCIVVLVMDIRHPLKDLDILLLDFAAAHDLPVHCLLTKADKLE